MSVVISFPERNVDTVDPLADLKNRIEQRYGVTLKEYMGHNGKRSDEVQERINRAMKKETIQMASRLIETR